MENPCSQYILGFDRGVVGPSMLQDVIKDPLGIPLHGALRHLVVRRGAAAIPAVVIGVYGIALLQILLYLLAHLVLVGAAAAGIQNHVFAVSSLGSRPIDIAQEQALFRSSDPPGLSALPRRCIDKAGRDGIPLPPVAFL